MLHVDDRSLLGGLLLSLLLMLHSAPTRADEATCQELERRYQALRQDSTSLQINSLLFSAGDNGCAALVSTLIKAGASVHARDREGNAALSRAARAGSQAVVQLLIEQGADLDLRNVQGSTPLFLAVESNRGRVIDMLLDAGADSNLAGRAGVSPLAAAAYNGNRQAVEMLLSRGADPSARDLTGKTPIVYAAARGFAEIVDMLLEKGIDINARYGNDLTILMWAAGHANDVPDQDGADLVAALIAKGARVDDADNRGRTPLMLAAEQGHAAVIDVLIRAGADVVRRDRQAKSATDLAPDEATRQKLATR